MRIVFYSMKFARTSVATLLTTAIIFLSPSAFADENKIASNDDCSRGSARAQYECTNAQLLSEQVELTKIYKQALASVKSHWGDQATKILKERLQATQTHWEQYRDGHCMHDYYADAPTHPPSQSLLMAACKLRFTKSRIDELKAIYMIKGE